MKTDNIINPLRTDDIVVGKDYSYKIVRAIGQGTFGVTYLADMCELDGTPTGMLICLKEFFMRDINGRGGTTVTVRSESGLFESYRHKFEREARNLASLSVENVVKVVEQFSTNNTVYYAMSYIHGGTLDDLIKKSGRLSERRTLEIADTLAEALTAIHSTGMAHLDLKPSNVMMLNGSIPVIIDFGLSKHFSPEGRPESSTTIGSGTPGYSPMEQANYRDSSDLPWPMDVYALGATMFKMLTGQRPPEASVIYNEGFPQKTLRDLGVSPSTISIVRKAMSPLRTLRYATPAELKRDIDEQLAVASSPSTAADEQFVSVAEATPSREAKGKRDGYNRPYAAGVQTNDVPTVQSASAVGKSDNPRHDYPYDHPSYDSRPGYGGASANTPATPPVPPAPPVGEKRRGGIPSWLLMVIIAIVTGALIFFGIMLLRDGDSDATAPSSDNPTELLDESGKRVPISDDATSYTLTQLEGDDMPSEIKLLQDGTRVMGVWHTRIAEIKMDGTFSDGKMRLKCRSTSMSMELEDKGNGVLQGTLSGPGDKKSDISFKRI